MKVSARRKARILTLQALYEWQLSQNDPHTIEAQILSTQNLKGIDTEYFRTLFQGVTAHVVELDKKIKPFLDRAMGALNPIELSVLRLATFELIYQLEIHSHVIINEALEVTKQFGAEDGYKYVNGVLDQAARAYRQHEMNIA